MRPLNERERAALRAASRILDDILAGMRGLIILAFPALLRVGCLIAVLVSGGLAFEPLWQAYGGDMPGLIPASVAVLAPPLYALMVGLAWGGLLGASLIVIALGTMLPALSVELRHVALMAVISVCIFNISRLEMKHERQR